MRKDQPPAEMIGSKVAGILATFAFLLVTVFFVNSIAGFH